MLDLLFLKIFQNLKVPNRQQNVGPKPDPLVISNKPTEKWSNPEIECHFLMGGSEGVHLYHRTICTNLINKHEKLMKHFCLDKVIDSQTSRKNNENQTLLVKVLVSF